MDTAKRLDSLQASRLLKRIVRSQEDSVAFTQHARDAMEEDDLVENDIVNTLRCGSVRDGELTNGAWRYRVETARITAVVAFQSEAEVVVVTVWRRGR